MPPRDELLLIIDLTSTIIRAGVGVHDLIRGPLAEITTRIARRTSAVAPYKITDYVVGNAFAAAEAAGEELDVLTPMTVGPLGLEVNDWTGLEAIMRYLFHTALLLPRPPLAHPVLLSLPPHLPPVLVDMFHALLFERLLVPQLLVGSRPFFAAAGSGVLSAVVLDIGARGEGTEVSVVHDSQVVEAATMRVEGLDEGTLDDWVKLQLLLEDPDLPRKLAGEGMSLEGRELAVALDDVVASLKLGEAIEFSSPLLQTKPGRALVAPKDDEGTFDVAQVLVEGKVDKIVGKRKGDKKDKKGDGDDDGDYVEVPHPYLVDAEPIRVGPARHRYLEPLFLPHILEALKPSASPTAQQLGLEEYETREPMYSGVQEIMGVVVGEIDEAEIRRLVWEGVVIVSSGKVAGIKALGPALIPLLSPFGIDPESGSETQPRVIKFAKVPDYFSEFKLRGGELGCYLGGCILAKILISDLQSKLFTSKAEYTAKGPATYRLLESL